MATDSFRTLVHRPMPRGGFTRLFNDRLIPDVIDAAGWCEAKVLQVEEATSRAPSTGILLALGAGMVVSLLLVPRRTGRGRAWFTFT